MLGDGALKLGRELGGNIEGDHAGMECAHNKAMYEIIERKAI